jgi:hypothetical protein
LNSRAGFMPTLAAWLCLCVDAAVRVQNLSTDL